MSFGGTLCVFVSVCAFDCVCSRTSYTRTFGQICRASAIERRTVMAVGQERVSQHPIPFSCFLFLSVMSIKMYKRQISCPKNIWIMFSILFGRRNLHWHTPPNERIQYHPVSCWCYWRMAENIGHCCVRWRTTKHDFSILILVWAGRNIWPNRMWNGRRMSSVGWVALKSSCTQYFDVLPRIKRTHLHIFPFGLKTCK